MPVPGDKFTLETYQDPKCNLPTIDPETEMVSASNTKRCDGNCHIFAGAPGADADTYEDMGQGPVEHDPTLLYVTRCVEEKSSTDIKIVEDAELLLAEEEEALRAALDQHMSYGEIMEEQASLFDVEGEDADQPQLALASLFGMGAGQPLMNKMILLGGLFPPHIPGTTDIDPMDPFDGLDQDELMALLLRMMNGDPVFGAFDPRYLWLMLRLMAWLRYLQGIKDALKKGKGRLQDSTEELKKLRESIFGMTDLPLGLGGPMVTPDNYKKYGKHLCQPVSGALKIDFSKALEALIGRSLDAFAAYTLSRLKIKGLSDFGSEVAKAFVSNLGISGTFDMQGTQSQMWYFKSQPPRNMRGYCRRAEKTGYAYADALDVRTIQSLQVAAEIGSAANTLLKTLKSVLDKPGDVFGQILSGKLDAKSISKVSARDARRAVEQLYKDFERLGDFGGMKQVDLIKPTASRPRFSISWARYIRFTALGGPDARTLIPYRLQEIYPAAIINAAVVPPNSDFFLRHLQMDYTSNLKVEVGNDLEAALKKALEEAIFAMFNKIVDAIKEDVKQRVADSLDVPKWAQDFADGLKKK